MSAPVKLVAWGYVTRDIGNGKEILTATRIKEGDPLRTGQFVIPGGGLRESEGYISAAMRETREETGITTYHTGRVAPDGDKTFAKPNLSGTCTERGIVQLKYEDSQREYKGRIIRLEPVRPADEPQSQNGSDARDPHYMLLGEAFANRERFTPACQVLLDLIREHEENEHLKRMPG